MGLKRLVDAAAEPITVAEATAHVRGLAEEADYIGGRVLAARQQIEEYTHRALLAQTWRRTLDEFPRCDHRIASYSVVGGRTRQRFDELAIKLPQPPLLSVTSVQYLDVDGQLQTLDPSAYIVDDESLPARVLPAIGTIWPTTQTGAPNAVRITYVAGYADPTFDNSGDPPLEGQALTDAQTAAGAAARALVPAGIRAAILLLAGDLYRNREGQITGTIVSANQTLKDLLADHRYREFA